MVWAYREEGRTSGSWSLKYPLSLSVATRGDRDKTAIGVERNGEAAYSICSHTANGPDIFRSIRVTAGHGGGYSGGYFFEMQFYDRPLRRARMTRAMRRPAWFCW